jgi:hypothetical protein
MDRLGERSFGIILLLLAFLALIPGVSPIAGILLTVPALQMIRAHAAPIFPHRLAHQCSRRGGWLRSSAGRCPSCDICGAPPAIFKAFHLSPLDDAVRGDETACWRRGALAELHSFCPSSVEQHSTGCVHLPRRLCLFGGGRRASQFGVDSGPCSVSGHHPRCDMGIDHLVNGQRINLERMGGRRAAAASRKTARFTP